MKQQDFVDYSATALAGETQLKALFLGGSFGRRTQDEFSDLDFIGLAEIADHKAVSDLWRGMIDAYSPVVFWSARIGDTTLINAITTDWLRVDLWLLGRQSFVERTKSGAIPYAQSTLIPVIDGANVMADLPPHPALPASSPGQVEYTINEFIRVLGLIAVGMGRGELVLGVTGAGLLRDLLTRLMVEETASPDRGGMLHLSRTITPAQMDELLALPYPRPNRGEILVAHGALARAFFPKAKRLALQLRIEWPAPFEEATKEHLRRAFGSEMELW
ncbi:hypothetical protein [Mesorhizobium sp. CAU 1732]|uniref:hypothetical protein n=1 Tax=Mesorhizobium sp. CAU 1732 TaxID=3140358 RepID=UPI0032616D31